MRLILPIIFLFLFTANALNAQVGGVNTFEFLNLSAPARPVALGGKVISVVDDDINLTSLNPSLLNDNMHTQLSLSGVKYFADIYIGNMIFAKKHKKYGVFSAGSDFINYGKFKLTDDIGNELGDFNASEFTAFIGWGKQIDSLFSVGANYKVISSSLGSYYACGFAFDLAGTYYNRNKELAVAAVIKNAGMQVKAYRKGNREPLPFDIQLGISKKLEHIPFRFTITAHHLYKFDIRYNDPNKEVATSVFTEDSAAKEKTYFADKLFRHLIFSGEILLSKNFHIRFGYDHLRRQELRTDKRFSTAGFSWGFGINIKKYHFSYARATYHAIGASNHITLSVKLSEFITKLRPVN